MSGSKPYQFRKTTTIPNHSELPSGPENEYYFEGQIIGCALKQHLNGFGAVVFTVSVESSGSGTVSATPKPQTRKRSKKRSSKRIKIEPDANVAKPNVGRFYVSNRDDGIGCHS